MSSEPSPVPAVETRTEKVMIIALLAIAALAIYGLFAQTERAASLARVNGDDGPAPVVVPPPTHGDATP